MKTSVMVCVISGTTYKCPDYDAPGRPVFHRDLHNCSKYYICINGEAVAKECQSGLHFNTATRQCDLSSRSDCGEL